MLLEHHSLENTTSWSKVPSFHYSLRQINYELVYIFISIVKVYEGFVIVKYLKCLGFYPFLNNIVLDLLNILISFKTDQFKKKKIESYKSLQVWGL